MPKNRHLSSYGFRVYKSKIGLSWLTSSFPKGLHYLGDVQMNPVPSAFPAGRGPMEFLATAGFTLKVLVLGPGCLWVPFHA